MIGSFCWSWAATSATFVSPLILVFKAGFSFFFGARIAHGYGDCAGAQWARVMEGISFGERNEFGIADAKEQGEEMMMAAVCVSIHAHTVIPNRYSLHKNWGNYNFGENSTHSTKTKDQNHIHDHVMLTDDVNPPPISRINPLHSSPFPSIKNVPPNNPPRRKRPPAFAAQPTGRFTFTINYCQIRKPWHRKALCPNSRRIKLCNAKRPRILLNLTRNSTSSRSRRLRASAEARPGARPGGRVPKPGDLDLRRGQRRLGRGCRGEVVWSCGRYEACAGCTG